MDFAVPVDDRVKLKNKKEEYVPRPCQGIEKNLGNMKVTIIPIVIGAFGTVPKDY